LVSLAGLLLLGPASRASTLYVDVNSVNPIQPYATWATAATNIQDAVDASVAGDQIVVTNGIYAAGGRAVYGTMTNRVAVDRAVALRSVNGPRYTIIQGYHLPATTNGDGAIRCVYLTNGASLFGFTLTNGATLITNGDYNLAYGGGLYCESTSELVSNCVLACNAANWFEGGSYRGRLSHCALTGNSATDGGGAAFSVLSDSTLSDNWAQDGGGGAIDCVLTNCALTGNSAGGGGGAASSDLYGCVLTSNSTAEGGGAAYSTLTDCMVSGNWADQGGGVIDCTLTNCLLTGNFATNSGGGAYGGGGLAVNCTLVGNSAGSAGGGGYGLVVHWSGFGHCLLYNSIIYSNSAPVSPDCVCTQYDSCLPAADDSNGSGNIHDPPQFVDTPGGDFRLQPTSPCINAGNNAYVGTPTDLDGNPRIVNGTADMGAYEFQGSSGLTGFHAWLAQYGLPSDGSADYADSDGDGMNNWQEWICGTNPTNAASVLRLLTPTSAGTNITVSWQSVLGIGYLLERSTNLSVRGSFLPLVTNLPGLGATTSFTDTNTAGTSPLYYRVGVGN
jgi:hypothetical protein